MAQHDYIIADQPGLSFRTDLNEVLAAIVSQNSGPTEPDTTYPLQWWADTTAGILKQRNAGNNAWNDVLILATGAPVGGVAQTGPTGAAILPEGDDAERPAEIPSDGGLTRANNTAGDYFLEFRNRFSNAWEALASRVWVVAKINELIGDSVGFTILYPNGGTSESPANISINSRYIMENPFPGKLVMCEAEILIDGKWGWSGSLPHTAVGSATGVEARTLVDVNGSISIVLQTGAAFLSRNSNLCLSPHGRTTGDLATPTPCRVKVWKVKGSIT